MRAQKMFLCAAIMASVTAPAFAMDNMMMDKGSSMIIKPDGTTATVKPMDDAMTMALMKKAKALKHGLIFMMGSDGKMYMMEDSKMPDGMMMSDVSWLFAAAWQSAQAIAVCLAWLNLA